MMSVLAPDLKITARASYKVFWFSKSFCYHFCDFFSGKVQQRFFSVSVNVWGHLAVGRDCCMDRCVSFSIGDIGCCALMIMMIIISCPFELYFRSLCFPQVLQRFDDNVTFPTLSRRNWTASICPPSTALYRGVRPALSWVILFENCVLLWVI